MKNCWSGFIRSSEVTGDRVVRAAPDAPPLEVKSSELEAWIPQQVLGSC